MVRGVHKIYLSAILDLYDRRIVSYVISDHNDNPIVFDTFKAAVKANPDAHPLFHSDRGFQYTNQTFHHMLEEADMTQSMSRVAHCIDNGPMEGFWGILKREKYYGSRFTSKQELVRMIRDYIVNAANSGMTGCYIPNHRCIDNAIHTFAGVALRLACAELMEQQGYPEPTGRAKITPAFNLPCRYVLHTVGPIIDGRVTKADKELLASCYRSCLALAAENNLESVAFCCISTGEFHFPNDLAAQIAVETVKQFMNRKTSVKKVIFNVFKDLGKAIYEKLLRAA